MKFAELPEEVKQAAVDTLKSMLSERVAGGIEPAKALSRAVKAAFTELYSPDS